MKIKTFEKFSGKVKTSNLGTEDVVELAGILFDLKPSLPDDFPEKELSKLINNSIVYLSDDEIFQIRVSFHESDIYLTEDGDIEYGKFKTIYMITITRNDKTQFKISDVKDFIIFTTEIVEKTYDEVVSIIKIEDKRLTLDEINKIDKEVDKVTLIIKIL
jgi:hypothetical protein